MKTTAPDPGVVLDLIEAFRRSKTMFTATSLGVFDRLGDGPATADALAVALAVDGGALERLLDACSGLGLLAKEGAEYRNTPVAETYLRRASANTLAGYILYSNEVLYPLWNHLEDAVKEGTHRWKQAFGLAGGIFSSFFRTEEAMRTFLLGMHSHGQMSSPAIVKAFDLSRYRRLVDLGGATGHLVIAACERYPDLRGIVLDLPGPIALAREMIARSPAAARIDVIEADFFTDPLPAGDLYALGRILHDWTEDKIRRLLAKIHAALPAGGALLIAEKLLHEDKCGPTWAQMQSLSMLVCTEGRERTLSEYGALLREAGFRDIEGRQTNTPLDGILALK